MLDAVMCPPLTRRVRAVPLAGRCAAHTHLHAGAPTAEKRWLKQPDLPGNSQTTVCLSACSAWEESTAPSPRRGTNLFNLSGRSKDLFLPLARLLLTVWNRRDCLLLPFATQVIEIFILPGRTAGCYFCFIQFASFCRQPRSLEGRRRPPASPLTAWPQTRSSALMGDFAPVLSVFCRILGRNRLWLRCRPIYGLRRRD